MNLQQRIALSILGLGGKKKIRKILNAVGNIDDFFSLKKHHLSSIEGIGERFLIQFDRDKALKEAEKHLPFILKNNISLISESDATYPSRLKQCADAPLILFSKGQLDCNVSKTVSIVGTRNASDYGKKRCAELVENLASKNILVVSGLAYGIDIFTHQLCVKLNIQNIGVLGHGLDLLYPSAHWQTATQMCSNGGLISEFLPGTKPDRENFPMRNRIVAGMTDATIVIESGAKGGSLITAELANDYAREVFAFPGNVDEPFSVGCNQLIQQQKAHLITCANDFMTFMDWDEPKVKQQQMALFPELNESEKKVYDYLMLHRSAHVDVLALNLDIPVYEMSVLMLQMELKGIIQQLPGDQIKIFR